jgi:SNF2 family DNA or RNA helicase
VIQQKCGRYGLNLACADTAYYFSNSLELEDRVQSEDRLVHPTKTTPANIVDLTTVDTVDEYIRAGLREGLKTSRSILQKVLVQVRKKQCRRS